MAVSVLLWSSVNVADTRSDSIRDRTVRASGYEEFRLATETPAISPALPQAGSADLIVPVNGFPDGESIVAVVLKPREDGSEYLIPTPPPGDNHYEFLNDHLRAAAEQSVGRVTFPAGRTFRLRPPAQGSHARISGFTDTVIDLNGSILEFAEVGTGLLLDDNDRVVVRNGTLRNPTALLATVARARSDSTEAGVDFEILNEYRTAFDTGAGSRKLYTIGLAEPGLNGTFRLRSNGYRDIFANRGGAKNRFEYGSGTWRGTSKLSDSAQPYIVSGYVWLLHENNNGHGIVLLSNGHSRNRDITLEGLVLQNIPGMGIVGEVERGLHVNDIELRVQDGPAHGFFATSSDGIHLNANGGDIVIENSTFGPNADDKITVKGNYWKVQRVDAGQRQLHIVPVERDQSVRNWGYDSQRVVFIDKSFGIIGETNLAQASERPGNSGSKLHKITLDRLPSGVEVGSLVGNVDNAGARLVVRNNVLEATRAQGVLIQTQHAAVIGNTFIDVAGPPVKLNIALELYYEGVTSGNVLIKDNTFVRSALASNKPNELVHFYQRDGNGRPVSLIGDVAIIGNRLSDSVGPTESGPPADSQEENDGGAREEDGTGGDGPDTSTEEDGAPDEGDPDGGETGDSSGADDVSALQVLYENKETVSDSDEIEARVSVVNTGSTSIDLRGFQLRYFFDSDGLTPAAVIRRSAPDATLGAGFVGGDAGYLAVTIGSTLTLVPEARWVVRFRIVNRENRSFDQSNDRSFDASAGSSAVPTNDILLVQASETSGPVDGGAADYPVDGVDSTDSDGGGNGEAPSDGTEGPGDGAALFLAYENKSTAPRSREIEAQLEIVNTSDEHVPLGGLRIRYFLDTDGLDVRASVRRSVPDIPTDVAIGSVGEQEFIEFTVNSYSTVSLAPGQQWLLRFEAEDADGRAFDQSNDPSWDRSRTSPGPSSSIELDTL